MKSSKNLRCGVAAAMFAALTCVLTMFIKIPIMGGQGYIHPGDMAIYLAASILPLPFAAAGAAIGGALADILGGAAVWAPWTLFIKAALTVFFTRKKSTVVCGRNFAACAAAAVVTGRRILCRRRLYLRKLDNTSAFRSVECGTGCFFRGNIHRSRIRI